MVFLYSRKAILRFTIWMNFANSIFSKIKQINGKLPDPTRLGMELRPRV